MAKKGKKSNWLQSFGQVILFKPKIPTVTVLAHSNWQVSYLAPTLEPPT